MKFYWLDKFLSPYIQNQELHSTFIIILLYVTLFYIKPWHNNIWLNHTIVIFIYRVFSIHYMQYSATSDHVVTGLDCTLPVFSIIKWKPSFHFMDTWQRYTITALFLHSTYCGGDKMVAVSQMTFSNPFFLNDNGCIFIWISLESVPVYPIYLFGLGNGLALNRHHSITWEVLTMVCDVMWHL